jgi:3-hydroxymyristoyl/3-hydroxydecanoyl-(acyl carrier protein) dehydratase
MLAEKKEVQELIPQKHPMAMVDGLVEQTGGSTTSRLVLDKENIFCENGYFSESGLIENIAQTAALRSGYEAKRKQQQPVVGFIGSLKRIKIHSLPKDNAMLFTELKVLNKLMNVQIVRGEVFCDGKLLAEGEMNIFLQQDEN